MSCSLSLKLKTQRFCYIFWTCVRIGRGLTVSIFQISPRAIKTFRNIWKGNQLHTNNSSERSELNRSEHNFRSILKREKLAYSLWLFKIDSEITYYMHRLKSRKWICSIKAHRRMFLKGEFWRVEFWFRNRLKITVGIMALQRWFKKRNLVCCWVVQLI